MTAVWPNCGPRRFQNARSQRLVVVLIEGYHYYFGERPPQKVSALTPRRSFCEKKKIDSFDTRVVGRVASKSIHLGNIYIYIIVYAGV